MSLPIPNLDDRNFEDLMKEALALIPVYDKNWTNYNPSDPGITLLELFSWLSEMTIYRINRIPEENYRRFLELLGIKHLFQWSEIPGNDTGLVEYLAEAFRVDWVKIAKIEKIDGDRVINIHFENHLISLKLNEEESKVTITLENGTTHELIVKKDLKIYESIEYDIRRGLQSVSKRYRAITSDDFEFLANECIESLQEGLAGRVICVNNRDLEYDKKSSENSNPGHVSVIIVPCIEKPEFSWENIPGKDNIRLLEFLEKIYGADWIKSANIEKSADGNTITIYDASNNETVLDNVKSISLRVSQKVALESGVNTLYAEKPDFSWDEIPGKDNIRLIKFLENIYGADWIKSAKIEKSPDGNAITVLKVNNTEASSDNIQSISVISEKRVILESRFYASYEFVSKMEQEESNVYCYTVDCKPSDLLKDQVRKYLGKRKLVTTRLHVVGPDYRKITLKASISLRENASKDVVTENVKRSISKYFSPLEGGKDNKGWPVGRKLYKSEIYQLLEGVPGVDHVVEIRIDDSDAESVELKKYQLIELTVDKIEVCDE